MNNQKSIRVLVASAFLSIHLACTPFFPNEIEPITLTANTPTKALTLLKTAYVSKDITEFTSLLSQKFIFWNFLTQDEKENPSLNPNIERLPSGELGFRWNREREIEIHKNMFDPINGAKEIELAFSVFEQAWQDTLEEGQNGKYIEITGISLSLKVHSQFHNFQNQRAQFILVQNPDTQLWEILKWRDLGDT